MALTLENWAIDQEGARQQCLIRPVVRTPKSYRGES